jgi:non-canonical poly(A) RNA polymerase PAPD5/7
MLRGADGHGLLTFPSRLNLEIQKFHNFIQPSQTETIARKRVIEQVRQHVQEILPDYVLEVFGSQRTGLAFAASDVDLRLVPVHVLSDTALSKMPPSSQERLERTGDLKRLFKALRRRHKDNYLLPVLRWARYPLISLHDRASGLNIQLVLSNDTSISREYMRRYMQEYPYLPRLYSTLKASLDVRGLSDVFRGGVGSYSLFMMIVASLKHKPHPRNDAAGALIHFLDFWVHLKAELYGVSIDPPDFFNKSEQIVMHRKALAHIAVSPATMAQPVHALTSPLGR